MSSNKPILEREYNFTDAVLEQFADLTAANLTRDMAELAPRGITPDTVTALQALREALSTTPTDVEERGMVGEAVEAKDAARDAALVEARRLRTAAQNVFGEDSAKYRRFGFTGMDKLNEYPLVKALECFLRVGTALQPQLASEGIDAAFLDGFTAAIEAYDNSLDAVNIAEEARDAQTEDRVEKGNTLYKEIVRVCNIGKDVFAPVSEAIYNDYVIENFVGNGTSGIPATSLIVKGKVTINETSDPIVGAQVSLLNVPNSGQLFTNTHEDGKYEFSIDDLPAGQSGTLTLTVDAPGFEFFQHNFNAEVGNVYTIDVPMTQQLQAAA